MKISFVICFKNRAFPERFFEDYKPLKCLHNNAHTIINYNNEHSLDSKAKLYSTELKCSLTVNLTFIAIFITFL